MSYSGYDIEDALVLNKASLDRGFGRCLVNRFIKDTLRNYANQTCDRSLPPSIDPVTKRPLAVCAGLDQDGISRPGARLHKKDFVVSKMSPVVQTGESVLANPRHIEYKNSSSVYRGPIPAVVDRVLLTTNEERVTMIKVIHSQCRFDVPLKSDFWSLFSLGGLSLVISFRLDTVKKVCVVLSFLRRICLFHNKEWSLI